MAAAVKYRAGEELPLLELLREGTAGHAPSSLALLLPAPAQLSSVKGSVVWLCAPLGMAALRWAQSAGFPVDRRSCYRAAVERDERALRLLCGWDPRTCTEALREGEDDVFEWAVGRGLPWDADLEVSAALDA
jgi:hypothetical protein